MNSKSSHDQYHMSILVGKLKELTGPERVLTDVEDIYVYSVEKIFEKPQVKLFDIVVKANSKEELDRIIEFAEKEKIVLVRRGKTRDRSIQSKPMILLDDFQPPEFQTFEGKPLKKGEDLEKLHSMLMKGRPNIYKGTVDLARVHIIGNLFATCKDCTTCASYCTVAPYFHFIETWSAKGRIILVRAFLKGELPHSDKLVNILYTCTLCGYCYLQCGSRLEVDKALIEARSRVAKSGRAPTALKDIAKNIEKFGSPLPFLARSRDKWIKELPEKLSAVINDRSETLVWIGCNTSLYPKIPRALTSVFKNADLNFRTLGVNETCCGGPLIEGGFIDEAKKIAQSIAKSFENMKVKTLITPCAGCYRTFTDFYPNLLNVQPPFEVLHTSQFFNRLINDKRIRFSELGTRVTYHDPCELGRHCGVYDEPRNVLRAIPNVQLLEPHLTKEYARCCGGGGDLWAFNHDVSMKAANIRLTEDIAPLKVDMLITACPQCYRMFRYSVSGQRVQIKVLDFSEVVALASEPEKA